MEQDTTSNETPSLLISCWHDVRTDSIRLRVVRTDTGEEVHLSDGSFLLRVFTDPDSAVVRCFIRHTGSGREAYLQSGLRIRDFVLDCLLNEHKKN